jgi:hypothetical protein
MSVSTVDPPQVATPGGGAATAAALSMFELRRFARSPLLWGATALALAFRLYSTWRLLPDMTVETIGASTTAVVIAVAVMISANLATTRDRRHGLPETLAALPATPLDRTRAVVLAGAAAGAVAASLMIAVCLVIRQVQGPAAGRFDACEALAGVAVAALAAAVGVALGRWAPSLIVVPVVILLWLFTLVADQLGEYGGWFLPVIPDFEPDWGSRPSGRHLVYLSALVVLLGAVSLLRHGLRPVRAVALLVALAIAVPAAATAGTPPMMRVPRQSDAASARREGLYGDRCETRDAVTYCALPGYTSWIPVWARTVRPLVSAVPPGARGHLPVVRQTALHFFGVDDQPTANVPMSWSSDPARNFGRVLAGQMAGEVVRLSGPCDLRGQARVVIALWLLGQVEPPAPATEVPIAGQSFLSVFWGHYYGNAELGYARRLLVVPGARERVWAHWDTLVNPRTTIDAALPLVGLRPERFAADTQGSKGLICRSA